ncbi:MAG: YacL family protein [Pseudomonadales bacterium]|nr:YacL family protein [Pseudomonadales bacterium]
MDYQFKLDMYGQPYAEFSMGHEAIGHWFNEELGNNLQKIDALLQTLQQLEDFKLNQKECYGVNFTLKLDREEVEIIAGALEEVFDPDEEPPEGTEFYDQESQTGCGMQDFKQALHSWKHYINQL